VTERLLPVMVDVPCERRAPTRFAQRGPGRLVVAEGALGSTFRELFGGTPFSVELTGDMKTALWKKLCFNAAGVISALTLVPARIFQAEDAAELARTIVREGIAVGRAEGATLDDTIADAVVEGYRRAPPDSVNSLHADRAAGRSTEIDARNGVIVRLGRRHGIATPCNAMAVALMNAVHGGEA
jgi:2-dehydropantoate 2-reductase